MKKLYQQGSFSVSDKFIVLNQGMIAQLHACQTVKTVKDRVGLDLSRYGEVKILLATLGDVYPPSRHYRPPRWSMWSVFIKCKPATALTLINDVELGKFPGWYVGAEEAYISDHQYFKLELRKII